MKVKITFAFDEDELRAITRWNSNTNKPLNQHKPASYHTCKFFISNRIKKALELAATGQNF